MTKGQHYKQIEEEGNRRYITTMTQRSQDMIATLAQLTHLSHAEARDVLNRVCELDQQGFRFEGIIRLLSAPAAQPEEVRRG